ncbi:MAG: chemotaxis protein CheW [Thermoleophilia bacterium]
MWDVETMEGGSFLNSPIAETQTGTLPFVILLLSDENFAVEIGKVREIIRVPKITWVPGVREPVSGVINLRGAIVPVVDMSRLTSYSATKLEEESRIIIAESDGVTVGLLVDAVSVVADIEPGNIETVMRTLDETQRTFIVAQTSVNDTLVGIIDVDHVIRHARDAQSAA